MIETNYGPKKVKIFEVNLSGVVEEVQRYVIPLTETSLNRLMKHAEDGMIIISAARTEVDSSDPRLSLRQEFNQAMEVFGGVKSIDSDALYDVEKDWLKRRNARKDRELKQDIRNAGYSYSPVYGGYHGQDDQESSYEPSYVVYNRMTDGQPGNFNDLENLAKEWCQKYGQESVYVQRPGQAPVYIDAQGNQINSSSSKDMKLNRYDQEFFTTTSRDKTNPQQFTADIQFENRYINLRPSCYNERLRRTKQGEFIL